MPNFEQIGSKIRDLEQHLSQRPFILIGAMALYHRQHVRLAETSQGQAAPLLVPPLCPQPDSTKDADLVVDRAAAVQPAFGEKLARGLAELKYQRRNHGKKFVWVPPSNSDATGSQLQSFFLEFHIARLADNEFEALLGNPAHDPGVVRVGTQVNSVRAFHIVEALELESGAQEFDEFRVAGLFDLLLMKAHTFADRMKDSADEVDERQRKKSARDIFRLLAFSTDAERGHMRQLALHHQTHPAWQTAAEILDTEFLDPDGRGWLDIQQQLQAASIRLPDDDAKTWRRALRRLVAA